MRQNIIESNGFFVHSIIPRKGIIMAETRNIVILKIGSNSISTKSGAIRKKLLESIAKDVMVARTLGWNTVIVSSGAVVCGKNLQGMSNLETSNQAYSMVGQRLLLNHWAKAFAEVAGVQIAQGLYTNRMLTSLTERKRSIREGLFELLRIGVVPILNENDGAVLDELLELMNEGDNDYFASLTGILLEAKLLVFLTTVEGVSDPDSGKLVKLINAKDKVFVQKLQDWPGQSRGGMSSKVRHGQHFVLTTGGRAVINSFDEDFSLSRAIRGVHTGTRIENL